MINRIQDKKELSIKLKERAIFEGFTVAGIASIPGSSRVKLRTNALERWLANCLLYTSDAADEGLGVDLGGRRIIKKNIS